MSSVEIARNVCGLTNANSTEFKRDTEYLIFDLSRGNALVDGIGGTLRLGNYPSVLESNTLAR